MKFRDPKTGEVFEDIEKARISYCSGKDCDHDCEIAFKRTTCSQWAKDHPAEAARLMGLEVVEEDVDLINRISKTPLTESEVHTFSMRLCDNEVDRDWDRFSTQALEKMSEMFIGKRGILGHLCSARIYRTELVRDAEKTTAAGDEYCCLKGWAYMLRNEQGKDVIAEIEAGIKKEVSVGCAVERSVCSICGADIGTCPHVKGKTYDGWLCFAELRNPTDVYEWSFVATPAKKKEEPMDKMDKPRIDWEKIRTGAAVWCRTEEEAKYLLDEGDRRGCKWFSGEPLTGHTNWDVHKENTVYCDFDGTGVVFSNKTCTCRSVIPFEHLITPDRPRICEVLGVEVGEVFTADTPYGRFQRCVIDEEGQILNTGTNVLCYILNHPDRIIRKPRFTEEELADAKVLMRALGATGLKRNGYEDIYATSDATADILLDSEMFPPLRPGQAVKLEEIINATDR